MSEDWREMYERELEDPHTRDTTKKARDSSVFVYVYAKFVVKLLLIFGAHLGFWLGSVWLALYALGVV